MLERTYPVPFAYFQATRLSSATAPARIAITFFSGYPAVTITSPLPTSGVWIALLSTPVVRHNSFPVDGSYAIASSVPFVTSSVRLLAATSTGVDQLICTGRIVFH